MKENADSSRAAEKFDLLLEELRPMIRKIVRLSFQIFKHLTNESEIEDVCQQIVFLLMKNDYQRLRSFAGRSSLNTWLRQVIFHYLGHYLNKSKELEELSETVVNSPFYAPTQENVVWNNEKNSLLQKALRRLSRHEQQLFELLCRDDLSVEDLAAQMNATIQAVYKQKQRLIRKIQTLISESLRRERKTGKNKF